MRKYMIGAIFGALLATAVSAHAEVISMIGKVVDGAFPVKVNGTTIDKQAIVIDGTSYLPVRAIGDALNMDVSFNTDLGIELKGKSDSNVNSNALQQTQNQPQLQLIKPQYFNKSSINSEKSYKKDNGQGDYNLIETDGNQYVSAVVLGGPYQVDWKKPNLIFKQDNKPDIIVNVSDVYQANVDGFIFEGTAYVKLSVLGLKATVNGDTLQIDKQ